MALRTAFQIFAALVSTALLACHSHQQVPKPPIPAKTDQVDRYLKAKAAAAVNDPAACDQFGRLARDESFALRELAKLRAEQTCLKGPIDYNSYTVWLRGVGLDAAIESAQRRGDDLTLANLEVEKSKQLLTLEEKLDWATQAKDLADKIQNQDLSKQAQDRIYMISPRLLPNPSEKDFLAVADDSRYHREFAKAEKFYRKIIGNPKAPLAEKLSAYRGVRQSYKNSRDRRDYLTANSQLIKFIEKNLKKRRKNWLLLRQLSDAMIAQARAQWTHGNPNDAQKTLRAAEKRMHGIWPMTEIYWLRARMAEERNDLTESNQDLSLALTEIEKDGSKDTDTRDKLRWQMAWNARRAKNASNAEALFQLLMSETQNESTHHRAAFWLGRTGQEMNSPTRQRKYGRSSLRKIRSATTVYSPTINSENPSYKVMPQKLRHHLNIYPRFSFPQSPTLSFAFRKPTFCKRIWTKSQRLTKKIRMNPTTFGCSC